MLGWVGCKIRFVSEGLVYESRKLSWLGKDGKGW